MYMIQYQVDINNFQTTLGIFQPLWTVSTCLTFYWVTGHCQLLLPSLDVGTEKAKKRKRKQNEKEEEGKCIYGENEV